MESENIAERPNAPFVIVGSGPVAVAFAHALVSLGTPPVVVASRTVGHAKGLCSSLGAPIPAAALDAPPTALCASFCGTVIVAVSDVALARADFAPRVSKLFPAASLVVHTSGALAASCLAGAAPRVLSMHPAVPFPPGCVTSLRDVVTALEGGAEAVALGCALSRFLGMVPFVLRDAGSKPLYHAACCMAANGAAVGVAVACGVLRTAAPSVDDRTRGRLARDLACRAARAVEGAVVRGCPPGAALTGPVSRGDVKAVSVHTHALRAGRGCEKFFQEAYRMIGYLGTGVAARAGRIDIDCAKSLESLLTDLVSEDATGSSDPS